MITMHIPAPRYMKGLPQPHTFLGTKHQKSKNWCLSKIIL